MTDDSSKPDAGEAVLSGTLGLEAELVKSRVRARLLRLPPASVQLRHFELEKVLGRGSVGVVFQALDTKTGARCALKTLDVYSEADLQRLKREFRALAGLVHPNLVVLHELFMDQDPPFFTMELLSGQSFLAHVRPGSEPDATRLRAALAQVVAGVRALHAQGWVHRDLKPSNVWVTEQGRAVIFDLGLAADLRGSALGTGADRLRAAHGAQSDSCGTPGYMAPEQWALDAPVGPAADWYAVGIMLHQALWGTFPASEPRDGQPRAEAPALAAEAPPPPADLEALAALCPRLLERDPALRLKAAQELDGAAQSWSVAPPRRDGPFVGREQELEVLERSLSDARAGKAVVALLEGPSGIGKTALLEQFCARLRPDARLLVGRCYEHETVPYKALDALVDDLARDLIGPPARALPPLDDEACYALLRTFPALHAVVGLAGRHEVDPLRPDDPAFRVAAVRALKALLRGAEGTPPTVLVVDDLQWGDTDSALLISSLLAAPDAPGVLFVGAMRNDDESARGFVEELRRHREQGTTHYAARHLVLTPLSQDDATSLARHLLSRAELTSLAARSNASCLAARVAAASRGFPFLIHALLETPRLEDLSQLEVSTEAALSSRIAELPATPRRLLLAVAANGQPLAEAVAREVLGGSRDSAHASADPSDDLPTAVRTLVGLKLLRTNAAGHLLTYHDKIREHVVADADEETLRACHARLAEALARTPKAAPAHLAEHYQRAGMRAEALHYALEAARRADEAWAFEQAARHYRSALSLLESESRASAETLVKLARALANAGKGPEAAATFLQALPGSDAPLRAQLRLSAARQYLRSGRTEEGIRLSRALLSEAGIAVPKGTLATLSSIAWQALVTPAVGPAPREGVTTTRHGQRALTTRHVERLDTLDAVFQETFIDRPLWGLWAQTRLLREALAAGDPIRISRALGWLAYRQSMLGQKRAATSLSRAQELADVTGDAHARALVATLRGGCMMWEGRFADGVRVAREAARTLVESCPGSYWEQSLNLMHMVICALAAGSLKVLSEVPERVREAHLRQDAFARNVLIMPSALCHLANDRPDLALGELELHRGHGVSPGEFSFAHTTSAIYTPAALRYLGDDLAAHRAAERAWPVFRRTFFYLSPMSRAPFQLQRALAALSAFDVTRDPSLLRIAERQARAAARVGGDGGYGKGLAIGVQATLAYRAGKPETALRLLEQARQACRRQQAHLFEDVVKSRLGEIIGGDRGAELVASTHATLARQGVENPTRFLRHLLADLQPRS